jgi:hypothetical protein
MTRALLDPQARTPLDQVVERGAPPEAFARFIREDIARWTRLARERKIDLDA